MAGAQRLPVAGKEEEEIVSENERGGVGKFNLPDKTISQSRRDIAIQMANVASEGRKSPVAAETSRSEAVAESLSEPERSPTSHCQGQAGWSAI